MSSVGSDSSESGDGDVVIPKTKNVYFSLSVRSTMDSELSEDELNKTRNDLKHTRDIVIKRLDRLQPKDPKYLQAKCKLWVIDGYLWKGLSITRLFEVSQTYEKLGLIPEGYM